MNQSRIYSDPEGLFNVQVPDNWLVDASGQTGFRLLFAPQEREGSTELRPNVHINVGFVPPLTREEALIYHQLKIKRLSQSEKLGHHEVLDSGAHVFEWTNQQAQLVTWHRLQLAFAKNRAFTITATCLPGKCDEDIDCFFDSFEIHEVAC